MWQGLALGGNAWQNVLMPLRPRDPAQLAKMIVDIATGEAEDTVSPGKKVAQRGRAGGLKGGNARARSLSKEKRSEIAKRAALSRWKG